MTEKLLDRIDQKVAQLVLTTGSRAGLVASIHAGYYLIGRDRECQIRPKSRSVSRIHCLIHFGCQPPPAQIHKPLNEHDPLPDDGSTPVDRVHVLDLNSTTGTKLDGQRVVPRKWTEVPSGTELRCGKIAWKVVLHHSPTPTLDSVPGRLRPKIGQSDRYQAERHQADDYPVADSDREGADAAAPVGVDKPVVSNFHRTPPTRPSAPEPAPEPNANPSEAASFGAASNGPMTGQSAIAGEPVEAQTQKMLQGAAWQEADVAAFLAAYDDADRQKRYEDIRVKDRERVQREEHFDADVLDDDRFFDDSPSDTSISGKDLSEAQTLAEEAADSDATAGQTKFAAKPKTKADLKAERAKQKKAEKKRKKARKAAAVAANSGLDPSIEKLKLIAATVLTLAVLGLGIYQVVQFASGPAPRVVDGID